MSVAAQIGIDLCWARIATYAYGAGRAFSPRFVNTTIRKITND